MNYQNHHVVVGSLHGFSGMLLNKILENDGLGSQW